ncbi:MAG: M3 family oligoendopeptidase [Anaerolineae bacterium]
MIDSLPKTAQPFMDWGWSQIEPYTKELEGRPLSAGNLAGWLADWTQLASLVTETFARLYVATTVDTTDKAAEARYRAFLDEIYPKSIAAEQKLKEKLLASGLQPPAGFELPLQRMQVEAALFREENLPLLTEERKLSNEFDKITGAQTVEWEGQEVTLPQLRPVFQNPDREVRERAWRLSMARQLEDRDAINALWQKFMGVRGQLAANADLDNYRSYRWREMLRLDYGPDDCMTFHKAIEAVAVPAALRIYERRRTRLGVAALRPWDLSVDPHGRPPLRPFTTVDELESKAAAMFRRVDPHLGDNFQVMRDEGLLDLENRKGKAPGGYCQTFELARKPFIFMNAVGLHDDVQTLLHEGGHAFHVFEIAPLPYIQQLESGLEFAEVASMAMELLAAPYLPASEGGFYSEADAARARIEHLEEAILFWPYMAVVDAFQHWVYTNHAAASDPANCDAKWAELWGRFMPGVDWSGLEQEMMTGWHRKLHIHQVPLYYVEYGLAQLGAVQVWSGALRDQAGAVARYRRALALGGTASLPDLYATAGAKFAFDAGTLGEAVALMERTIAELDTA